MWFSRSKRLGSQPLPVLAFTLLAWVLPVRANDAELKAILVQVEGQVSISRLAQNRRSNTGEGTKLVVAEGMKLARNDKITTSEDGVALVQLFEGLTIAVRNNSSVMIEELSVFGGRSPAPGKPRALVDLFAGQVVLHVDPAKCAGVEGGIRTPRGVVVPAGTATVRVSGADVTVTAVRGEARVASPLGTRITVKPDHHLRLSAANPVPVAIAEAGQAAAEDVAAAEAIWRWLQGRSGK